MNIKARPVSNPSMCMKFRVCVLGREQRRILIDLRCIFRGLCMGPNIYIQISDCIECSFPVNLCCLGVGCDGRDPGGLLCNDPAQIQRRPGRASIQKRAELALLRRRGKRNE